MSGDSFQQAWQSQSRLTIDAEMLLKEVQRNQRQFTATIFWRDVREVGVALLLIAVWIYTGVRNSSPWTWYLAIPGLIWIAAFLLASRVRQRRRPPASGQPLRQGLESSLAEVEHQIWLLRNVFWWYLLPIALPALAFFGQSAWKERAGGWWTALALGGAAAVAGIILAGVYWLNQKAVRAELEPRRQELEALLRSLQDEESA